MPPSDDPWDGCGRCESHRERGERAVEVAVALESELTALRIALDEIHSPRDGVRLPSGAGYVVCGSCREEWPCETRVAMDALDPKVELDLDVA